MHLKLLLVIITLAQTIYELVILYIKYQQYKKPIPNVVSHIYSKQRYEQFKKYRTDYLPITLISKLSVAILTILMVSTDFYTLFNNQNPYLTLIFTFITIESIKLIVQTPLDYYATFTIEEKYGLNKQTKKGFFKDLLIETITSFLITSILFSALVFICTHLSQWTNNFSFTFVQSLMITIAIFAVLFVLFILLSLISLVALRLQYKFTPLQDGSLKTEILNYISESKKKIYAINVYNESSKSTSKNAFLLKLLWYKEFGIADNFLDENSHDELCAVLLHEIGHLKHKKNIYNYLNYLFIILTCVAIAVLINNAQWIISINQFINDSFHLSYTNYYLSFSIFSLIVSPIGFMYSIFHNIVSCKEEHEADANAVNHGYGQALIDTFTKLSSDELVDINPAPLIETLYYDHPSMPKRIGYIRQLMSNSNH